jgi:MerR family transcriptional regulator/heat shock protein HspR
MMAECREKGRVNIERGVSIAVAAKRTGISPRTVRRYIRRGLVSETLSESELARLRRVRRLRDLGINLAGIEVVLRMRRRIEELQAKMARLQANRPDR